jgi:hypothetical protein
MNMKTFTKLGSIMAAFTLLSTLALAAPKAERADRYFKVAGKVIQIDRKDRTLLVTDSASNKLYLIKVPDRVTFKITFGKNMQLAEPGFNDVNVRERVEIRCLRDTTEHLSRLGSGRYVTTLSATR